MKDAFGATLLEPLVSRAFELRLKLALKAADAHVRQGCKILNVADPFIIFVDEILEMGAISYDVVQKSVQLLRSMITAKKDAELLLLDLMEMDAVKTVVQGSGQHPEKVRNLLFYTKSIFDSFLIVVSNK